MSGNLSITSQRLPNSQYVELKDNHFGLSDTEYLVEAAKALKDKQYALAGAFVNQVGNSTLKTMMIGGMTQHFYSLNSSESKEAECLFNQNLSNTNFFKDKAVTAALDLNDEAAKRYLLNIAPQERNSCLGFVMQKLTEYLFNRKIKEIKDSILANQWEHVKFITRNIAPDQRIHVIESVRLALEPVEDLDVNILNAHIKRLQSIIK